MKKLKYLIIFITALSCNSQEPAQFSEAALKDTFITLNENKKIFTDILEAHKGKTILIDVWASWCGDCIKGMPKVKALQKEYDETVFVFLSLDRNEEAWKRGIKKYDVNGEHYFLPSGKDSAFGDFVNIDWIPRYMVVGPNGNITLFKAVEADDIKIKQSLMN